MRNGLTLLSDVSDMETLMRIPTLSGTECMLSRDGRNGSVMKRN